MSPDDLAALRVRHAQYTHLVDALCREGHPHQEVLDALAEVPGVTGVRDAPSEYGSRVVEVVFGDDEFHLVWWWPAPAAGDAA